MPEEEKIDTVDGVTEATPMGMNPLEAIGKFKDLIELATMLASHDGNFNGVADWKDLITVGKAMFSEFEKFKIKLPTLQLGEALVYINAFKDRMIALSQEAQKLVGDDIPVFKAKFPEIFAVADEEATK